MTARFTFLAFALAAAMLHSRGAQGGVGAPATAEDRPPFGAAADRIAADSTLGADSTSAADLQSAADSTSAATDSTLAGTDSTSASADTSRRVTGTPFRFGGTVAMAQRHGDFPIAKVPGRRGEVARAGPGRWFGLDGTLTLFFHTGRLQRVRFKSGELSPRARDYAQDQLHRAGFRRSCERAIELGQNCTWRGRSEVLLEMSPTTLTATIDPPPVPPAPPPVAAPVAQVSEVFVLGRPGAVSRLPVPVVRLSPRPEYPDDAQLAGVQANIWVRALVDTSGTVLRATVTKGIPLFHDAAVANAMRWRFEPYRLNGTPARFEVEFPVRYVFH